VILLPDRDAKKGFNSLAICHVMIYTLKLEGKKNMNHIGSEVQNAVAFYPLVDRSMAFSRSQLLILNHLSWYVALIKLHVVYIHHAAKLGRKKRTRLHFFLSSTGEVKRALRSY